MKILFDIVHPADVNFFKAAIKQLLEAGNQVVVSYRNRGKLESILRYEYQGLEILKIGEHQIGIRKKLIHQFLREFRIFALVWERKIDVVACFGAVSAIGARLAGAKFIAFDDDYEYKLAFYQPNLLSNKHVYPDSIPFRRSNVITYKGYKELAYLHKNRLRSIDEPAGIGEPYCFIRVISRISLNYQNEMFVDWPELVSALIRKGMLPVISLEDKEAESRLKELGALVLKEPVPNIYAMIKQATMVISFGDTVARESSILAVPTFYFGIRDMAVNIEFVNLGIMKVIKNFDELIRSIESFEYSSFTESIKKVETMHDNWDDTTSVIVDAISRV